MKTYWSRERLATGAVLALWAAAFAFLLLSGRSRLYLSSRTDWLVPVGAVTLVVATIGRIASARVGVPEPLTARGARGLAAVALPALLIVALPPASLGSFASARRSDLLSAGYVTSVEDISDGDLSLADVAGAVRSEEAMRVLVARAGEEVSFTGFVVTEPGMPPDEFLLSRFVVSCCVADALSVQVRVVNVTPGTFTRDGWVRVTGALYPLGQEIVVDAASVDEVSRPKHPYLNP